MRNPNRVSGQALGRQAKIIWPKVCFCLFFLLGFQLGGCTNPKGFVLAKGHWGLGFGPQNNQKWVRAYEITHSHLLHVIHFSLLSIQCLAENHRRRARHRLQRWHGPKLHQTSIILLLSLSFILFSSLITLLPHNSKNISI